MLSSLVHLALLGVVNSFSVPSLPALNPDISGNTTSVYLNTCQAISRAISHESAVFYPGSAGYAIDNYHWQPSGALDSACTVEPANVDDVSAIVRSFQLIKWGILTIAVTDESPCQDNDTVRSQ